MTIGFRIGAGFAIVILIMAIVGYTGYSGLSDYNLQVKVIDEADSIIKNTYDAVTHELRFFIYGSTEYTKKFDSAINNAIKAAQDVRLIMTDQESIKKADRVLGQLNDFKSAFDDFKRSQAQKQRAIEKMHSQSLAIIEKFAFDLKASKEKWDETRMGSTVGYDIASLTYYISRVMQAYTEAMILGEQYETSFSEQDQRVLLREWLKKIDTVNEILKEDLDFSLPSDFVAARQKALDIINEYKKNARDFSEIVAAQKKATQRMAEKAVDSVSEADRVRTDSGLDMKMVEEDSKFYIYSVSLAGLILGIFLAIFITRRIRGVLNKISDELFHGAGQITSASGQVSSASQSLAGGTSEQASSLEEISASLEQLAAMIQQNSDNAGRASAISKEARNAAENGTNVIHKMKDAISRIKKSSDETAKIIKTIDEIAFQTNLLALNAAVEAARAGEAGKGFAVVAEEVRNLAQRSAQAAKNTSELISESQNNADSGVQVTDEVTQIFSKINESSNQVTTLIEEVAHAAIEQTSGVNQITEAVSQIDQVTQANAANAEETASSSEELSSQANVFKDIVDQLLVLVEGTAAGSDKFGSSGDYSQKKQGQNMPAHEKNYNNEKNYARQNSANSDDKTRGFSKNMFSNESNNKFKSNQQNNKFKSNKIPDFTLEDPKSLIPFDDDLEDF
jgi:methyl-accepting chemotaxis protein